MNSSSLNSSQTILNVGIDIGSTTIKVVVLNQSKEIIYKTYERHFSEIGKAFYQNLLKLKKVVGENNFSFTLTGSAAMGVAQRVGLPFVQEVIACASAVKSLIPQTDTAVELGGEDAKITYFGRASEQRMNGICAGGTGAFIDHMAALLSTDAIGLNALAEKGKQIYTIASRCGVFAKTDIQALLNDGVAKADIALSIFQAVVNQTISNLAQGRPISGKVAFLGGPLYFLSALKKRFVETLHISNSEVVDVQDGCYFVAMGAALSEESQVMDFEKLSRCLEQAKRNEHFFEHQSKAFVLFENDDDYEKFCQRHGKDKVPRGDLKDYQGALYLGIDAGSTTTKLVAIGAKKELLYTDYDSNHGSPLQSVVKALKKFYQVMDPRTQWVASVITTGYGEGIVKAAIHADGGEVETMAHLKAAQEFCPDVSFVLDIGGQDMKCFFVDHGTIGNITLNEACSAGCGSFIQNFAQGLNLTTEEFAKMAVQSREPVDLGTRCTVFMNSRVKQAQKEGAKISDISAGIALSVIKNALFKVMQLRDVTLLGDHIVVQGGTFYNDAVLRAMEKLLKKEVIRPDIAGLMGAYGAALLALENSSGEEKSSILSQDDLEKFSVQTKSYRCHGCGNSCLVTMSIFSDGSRYFSGNRCERGIGKEVSKNKAPSVYEYKWNRLFDFYLNKQTGPYPLGKIGLPRVLNMYEDFPFWFTFFRSLGYEVVLSQKTTSKTYFKGMATVPSDSLCYPAKLVHGHIMDLLEQGCQKIFYPCLPYNIDDKTLKSDNHFNCPVVASYPENIRNNMDVLKDIKFMQPFLPIDNPKRMKERLVEELVNVLHEPLTKEKIHVACDLAYEALQQYKNDVQAFGKKLYEKVLQENTPAIVLVGRPYHVDPEINHGIPEMIQSFGLTILSEDCLTEESTEPLNLVNQWTYHARLYRAAEIAATHDNLTLIQLSSFGCGLDAITIGEVRDILERHHRLYTLIKLDEVSNLGAARIRVRSLLAAMKRKQSLPKKNEQPILLETTRPHFTKAKPMTIFAPQMAPIQFDVVATALKKYGYRLVIPKMPERKAIDLGLRYVHNDMCYPAIVVIGQLLNAVQSGECDPNSTAMMLFQTCGACRATNYLNLLRKALKDLGFPQIPVFAGVGRKQERDDFSLSAACVSDLIKSVVYGDLLMKVKNRVQPYEIEKGSTQKLYERCLNDCKKELLHGNFLTYRHMVSHIVEQFDNLPINETIFKPKVGIVGEILVKYHPTANNHLEEFLLSEGAEVVMPDLLNFFEYCAFDDIVKEKLLAGSFLNKVKSHVAIRLLEFYKAPVTNALKKSKRFEPSKDIFELAALAKDQVSLANMAGEGWFLTAEMMELLESDVPNVVCLQPFGCLPNHITGKGVLHALRERYPYGNIIALDCDAGASEVNQANRIKLMLAVAHEHQQAHQN